MKFSRIKYSTKSAKQIKADELIFLPTINSHGEVVGGQFVQFVGVNVSANLLIYKYKDNSEYFHEWPLKRGFQTITQ